jgi:hypothetical protein
MNHAAKNGRYPELVFRAAPAPSRLKPRPAACDQAGGVISKDCNNSLNKLCKITKNIYTSSLN